ncbi:MAG: hypothetical protein AAFX01_03450 [Cyanobacteria bacterium J06638_28]
MGQKSMHLDLPNFNRPTQGNAVIAPQPTQKAPVKPDSGKDAASLESATLPFLPDSKRPTFSSHRNDANAALALDLLTDVEDTVTGWHQALRQTLMDLQNLYMSGPIIEGWLESGAPQEATDRSAQAAQVLRHGDAAQVAAYVDQLAKMPQASEPNSGSQYRLCSLDADGKMQCQPCPPEQLGVVSQAIARHQQLRQLLQQKQYLEARLKSAADVLAKARQALGIASNASE